MKIILKQIFIGVFVFLFAVGWLFAGWQWIASQHLKSHLRDTESELINAQDKVSRQNHEMHMERIWFMNLQAALSMGYTVTNDAVIYGFTGSIPPTTHLSQLKAVCAIVENTAPTQFKDVSEDYASNLHDIGISVSYLGRPGFNEGVIAGRIRQDMGEVKSANMRISEISNKGLDVQQYNFDNGNVPDVSNSPP